MLGREVRLLGGGLLGGARASSRSILGRSSAHRPAQRLLGALRPSAPAARSRARRPAFNGPDGPRVPARRPLRPRAALLGLLRAAWARGGCSACCAQRRSSASLAGGVGRGGAAPRPRARPLRRRSGRRSPGRRSARPRAAARWRPSRSRPACGRPPRPRSGRGRPRSPPPRAGLRSAACASPASSAARRASYASCALAACSAALLLGLGPGAGRRLGGLLGDQSLRGLLGGGLLGAAPQLGGALDRGLEVGGLARAGGARAAGAARRRRGPATAGACSGLRCHQRVGWSVCVDLVFRSAWWGRVHRGRA